MSQTPPTNKISRTFTWLAWLSFFGLLVFLFNEYLEDQYNPNREVETSTNFSGKSQVILQQNRAGHYLANGTINQQAVTFLLDTGATQVSVPAHLAERLYLDRGRAGIANTANGQVTVYQTEIAELTIGNIQLYNVSASINPGMKSDEILLGMSVLKQVQFRQTGKQLILEY